MNEDSPEPIIARLGLELAEKRCVGFGSFSLFFLHDAVTSLALWGGVLAPQEVRGWVANCWRKLLPL